MDVQQLSFAFGNTGRHVEICPEWGELSVISIAVVWNSFLKRTQHWALGYSKYGKIIQSMEIIHCYTVVWISWGHEWFCWKLLEGQWEWGTLTDLLVWNFSVMVLKPDMLGSWWPAGSQEWFWIQTYYDLDGWPGVWLQNHSWEPAGNQDLAWARNKTFWTTIFYKRSLEILAVFKPISAGPVVMKKKDLVCFVWNCCRCF